jgi:hypothetical protein
LASFAWNLYFVSVQISNYYERLRKDEVAALELVDIVTLVAPHLALEWHTTTVLATDSL